MICIYGCQYSTGAQRIDFSIIFFYGTGEVGELLPVVHVFRSMFLFMEEEGRSEDKLRHQ